jgi:hypothetical protein
VKAATFETRCVVRRLPPGTLHVVPAAELVRHQQLVGPRTPRPALSCAGPGRLAGVLSPQYPGAVP